MNKLYEKLKFYKDIEEESKFEELMETIPLESQENVRYVFNEKLLEINDAIYEAQNLMFVEDDDPALSLLYEKIELLEEENPPMMDDHYVYYSIQSKLEYYLFELLESSGKELMYAKENYGLLYQTVGAILLAQGKIQEAKEYFKISLQWNPYDLETRLFEAEVLKMNEQMDAFYFANLQLMKMASSSKCISIIYQNFAQYYLYKNDKKSSLYSVLMSMQYGMEPDPFVADLIEKIGIGEDFNVLPSEQEIYSYFISEGIPVPPNDDLYMYFLEKALDLETVDLKESMFCLNILDDIKNSLEKENDDEKRIRQKYNRKVSNQIHKIQKIPMRCPLDGIVEQLFLTKVYVPFLKEIEDIDDFPCGLVENNQGDVFLPMYLFPSKIPQSVKSEYEIRQVPFSFGNGILEEWEEVIGIVLHPFSKDSLEILREDF